MIDHISKTQEKNNYELVSLDKKEILNIINKYPADRRFSAVLPLLHYVQKKAE